MTSPPLARPALVGRQTPTLELRPPRASEASDVECIELCSSVGLDLDPWQRHVLHVGLGETAAGDWAAPVVGLDVARQSGKGSLLVARELAGLFIFGEQLLIHTAHLFATALEAWRRIVTVIEGSADLSRLVRRVIRSHGEEGIELRSGARLLFRARSGGAGRGFSGDLVVLDEAMILTEQTMSDLQPTMAARPNAQMWLTGSAGFADSTVWHALRRRAVEGVPGLAWCGWGCADDADPEDRSEWRRANPALGIRIGERSIESELAVMTPAKFRRERLGVWDPEPQVSTAKKISAPSWADCRDRSSQVVGPVWLAVDVSPDRSRASLAVAGLRSDGLAHVELPIDVQRGTSAVADHVARLCASHQVVAVVVDSVGPAAGLADEIDRQLRARGLSPAAVRLVSTSEHGEACGHLVDRVGERSVRHLGQGPLDDAVTAAVSRPLGDRWAWSRSRSDEDISPLVAATLALWAVSALALVDVGSQVW